MSQSLPDSYFLNLINALPVIITHLDQSFRVLRQFNAANTPLETPAGEWFQNAFHEDMRQIREVGDDVIFEAAIPGDENIWYSHHAKLLPDQQGIVVTSTEITAKQVERNTQKQVRFLERLLDTIDAGVSVFNFDTMQATYVNEYKQRLHGKPLSETSNHNYLDDIHPEDYEDAMTYGLGVIRNLDDGEIATKEYRIIDADGKTRWVMVRDMVLSRGEDGRVMESIGVMVDITERKAMEAELNQVNRWFNAIMDNSADAIAISERSNPHPSYNDFKLITANTRLQDLTGYSFEELQQMNPSDLLADEERLQKASVDAVTSSGLRFSYGKGKRKDGSYFLFETMGIAILDESGVTREFIAFVRDITERKQREQALRDAQIKAETAVKARDAFIANMSHELRSPLNTIQGHVQLLLEDQNLPLACAETLRLIDYSADHLSRLIGDILDLSRIEAGFDALHPVNFNLRYLIKRLHGMLSIQARRSSLDFEFQIDDDVPDQLRMDEVKLKQTLINIVGNAIKYTPQGQVSVHLARDHEGILRFAITDTGPGMSEQDINQLAQPFERGDNTDWVAGTGLGLAITQRLVALMDGQMTISATEGQGTTITIDLPYEQPQDYQQTVADTTTLSRSQEDAVEILVVDDQPIDRQVLVTFLGRRGFSVHTADNGQAALSQIIANPPALIFIDLRLPGMDGAETVARIRKRGADLPIIAVTADATPEGKQRLLDAGCNEVIFKPYRLDQISIVIGRYLNISLQPIPKLDVSSAQTMPMLPTVEQLAALPQVWLETMYEICLSGGHNEAENHLQRIENEHPEITSQLRTAIMRFWTTQIADLILPLLD